jgi:hypothetical protein
MPPKKNQQPSDEKLRELILYLASLSVRDEKFGAVKLNKLLFYADFLAYQRFGTPITGQEYQALPQGPCPRRLKPVVEYMKKAGDLKERVERKFHFNQKRPIAIRTANLSKFSAQELNLVEEVVGRFWNMNATQISDESHLFLGWKLAKEKETIPYSVVLIGSRRPTDAEKRKGQVLQKLAKEAVAGHHR